MAKKVPIKPGKGNQTRAPLPRAVAARAGKMFEALLALDLEDEEQLGEFALDYLPALEFEQIIPLLSSAAELLDVLRHDLTLAGDSRRIARALIAAADGIAASRARVVATVKELFFYYMKFDALDDDLSDAVFSGLLRPLVQYASEFERLPRTVVATWFERLRNERQLSASKKTSLTLCAAAFSIEVGAFGDRRGQGETVAEASRRVEKSFRNACAPSVRSTRPSVTRLTSKAIPQRRRAT